MNDPRCNDRELDRLMSALCDGDLSDADLARLDELLRNDPAAQLYYVRCLDMHLQMDRLLLGVPQPAPAPTQPPSRAVRVPGGWAGVLFTLAAGVLLAVLAYQVPRWLAEKPILDRATVADTEPEASGVAVLARSVRVQWPAGTIPLATGASVPCGTLKLKSGTIQLEFYSGATVVLEGPASLELLATDRVRCLYGKLRANVPPQARGFTILSSAADLVDLGTEFGLQVSETGAAEVHVFEGKVEVYEPGADRATGPKRELTAGKGVRLDGAGQQVAIDANTKGFLSAAELDRQVAQAAAERFEKWQKSSRKLRKDPRLIVYYSFQHPDSWDRRLLADNTDDEDLQGAIVGCQWVEGRWPGKGALEFKRPSDRVRIHVPGEYTSLTYMAWLRVDALDYSFNALCLTDGFAPGAPHWQINRRGQMVLGVKTPADVHEPHDYRSSFKLGPQNLGQWTHLATVYDAVAGMVTHHVNGRVVYREAVRFDVNLCIGQAEIGNWGVPRTGEKTPIRNLNGRMDEFLLFSEPLTAKEIQEFYTAGKPG